MMPDSSRSERCAPAHTEPDGSSSGPSQTEGPGRYDKIKTLQQVDFDIDWATFDNDDLYNEDDPDTPLPPDDGWYVTVTVGDRSHQLGPDHYGPGFATIDEALALCRKWAEDRGFEWSPPSLRFTQGKWV